MAVKETIKVGVANEGETNMDVELIKSWIPKNITYSGDIVIFKADKKFYSMKRDDFKKIFNI